MISRYKNKKDDFLLLDRIASGKLSGNLKLKCNDELLLRGQYGSFFPPYYPDTKIVFCSSMLPTPTIAMSWTKTTSFSRFSRWL